MSCLDIDLLGPLDDTDEVTLARDNDLEIFLSALFGIAPSGVGDLGVDIFLTLSSSTFVFSSATLVFLILVGLTTAVFLGDAGGKLESFLDGEPGPILDLVSVTMLSVLVLVILLELES